MSQVWWLLGRGLFWLSWPALYIYLRLRARTRVYVVADGQVLLVRGWLSGGGWMLPGGGLHRHEDVRVGAVREVYEESGIMLEPDRLTPIKSEWRSSYGLKSYLHFFAATIDSPDTLRRQKGEITDVRWFRIDELQNAAFRAEVLRALELLGDH